jgi:hypothetical protein
MLPPLLQRKKPSVKPILLTDAMRSALDSRSEMETVVDLKQSALEVVRLVVVKEWVTLSWETEISAAALGVEVTAAVGGRCG